LSKFNGLSLRLFGELVCYVLSLILGKLNVFN
jgi:hypothetical protein